VKECVIAFDADGHEFQVSFEVACGRHVFSRSEFSVGRFKGKSPGRRDDHDWRRLWPFRTTCGQHDAGDKRHAPD
jgi:hypothetical protein